MYSLPENRTMTQSTTNMQVSGLYHIHGSSRMGGDVATMVYQLTSLCMLQIHLIIEFYNVQKVGTVCQGIPPFIYIG